MSDDIKFKARDCHFSAELEVSPSSEESKSAPFEMIARTGEAINHHHWGRVVHDLDGMEHKKRIPIDFNHNPNDIVGYGNRFSTDTGDLKIRGALTPYKDSDRATEILFKSQADKEEGGGVPYEASINFAGDMVVEKVPEGKTVTVNQREFTGPLKVVRKWKLRGVAVTPYGYDSGTLAEFSNDDFVNVTFTETEEMTDKAPEINPLDTEGENKIGKAEKVVDEAKNEEVKPEDSTLSDEGTPKTDDAVVDGKLYMTLFGRMQGALYFAEGLSLEDASKAEMKRLQDENKQLKEDNEKLAAQTDDLDEPLPDSMAGEISNKLLTKMPGEVAVQEAVDGNEYRS